MCSTVNKALQDMHSEGSSSFTGLDMYHLFWDDYKAYTEWFIWSVGLIIVLQVTWVPCMRTARNVQEGITALQLAEDSQAKLTQHADTIWHYHEPRCQSICLRTAAILHIPFCIRTSRLPWYVFKAHQK